MPSGLGLCNPYANSAGFFFNIGNPMLTPVLNSDFNHRNQLCRFNTMTYGAAGAVSALGRTSCITALSSYTAYRLYKPYMIYGSQI